MGESSRRDGPASNRPRSNQYEAAEGIALRREPVSSGESTYVGRCSTAGMRAARKDNSATPSGTQAVSLERDSARMRLQTRDVEVRPDSEANHREEPAGKVVRVKGINFISFLAAVEKTYGLQARTRIERDAAGDFGNALRFGAIVAGGWYPIRWYREMWRLIAEQLGMDDVAVRRLSQKATGIGVNVVYRALAKVSSPGLLIESGTRIFGHYFDRGRLEVKENVPGRIVVEWTECFGFDTYVWNHVAGGVQYFLEAAGATLMGFAIQGGGKDDSWMRATVTYR
ncbi:MAG: hypothetical protein QM784_02920 [Polyangiaceae bacterium]